METKKITYHIDVLDPAPEPGQYIVYCGKRGISQVNLIRTVRKVNHKTHNNGEQGYHLTVVPQPHLKELTVMDEKRRMGVVISCQVWVKGEPAWPSYWIPRGKK